MSRQLPVEWAGGHMIVDPFPGSGLRALIDTGAGHTASHRRGDGYLGKTLADIEGMANTRIDLLVGLDAFLHAPVLLTRDFVEFGAARPDGHAEPLTSSGSVSFRVQIAVRPTGILAPVEAFFDSGAEHSYVAPRYAGHFVGMAKDFFPPIGGYDAFEFRNLIQIGEHGIELWPIVAADQRIGVTSDKRPLLIGSELIRHHGDLWIDFPGGEVVYRSNPSAPAEYCDTVRYLNDREETNAAVYLRRSPAW